MDLRRLNYVLAFVVVEAFADDGGKTCTTHIEQIHKDCPETGQTLYADPDHCSMYWECWEGCATHSQCQLDYLFIEEPGWCEYPQKVQCGSRDCDGRSCMDDSTPQGCTLAREFKCPQRDGYFEDPKNCIKYFHCVNARALSCICQKKDGEQLYWKQAKVWCDWLNNVECGGRPICDGQDNNCRPAPTVAPNNCDILGDRCHSEGALFPLGRCEKCFCMCAHHEYTEICCPAGTVFNPKADTCDYRYNVEGCPGGSARKK